MPGGSVGRTAEASAPAVIVAPVHAAPAEDGAGGAPVRFLLPAYLTVAAITATMFAHAAGAAWLRDALSLNLTELGLLLSAMIVGHGLVQPAAGLIFNRLGPDRALGLGLLYLTVMSLLVTLPDDWQLLAGLRAVQGLGTGALFVFGTAYVAAYSTAGQIRGRQAWYGMMTGVGAAVAFAAVPVAVVAFGWRGVYAAPLAMTLLADAALLLRGRPGVAPGATAKVGVAAFRRLLGAGYVWRLGLAHAGSFGVFVALSSWLTTLYLRATGGNPALSAELAAGVLFVSAVARLAGAPAAARWGDRPVIVGSLSAAAATLLLLGLGAGAVGDVVFALSGVWWCSFTFAGIFHLAYTTSRPGEAPTVISLINAITLAVGMALPALFGWLADSTGTLGVGFALYAVACAIGGIAVATWRPAGRLRPLGRTS